MSDERRWRGAYIQYGCGASAPDGWLNFDCSPRLRFERLPIVASALSQAGKALFPPNVRYGDIVAGLPVERGSARGVYCSHILEHLPREDLPKALGNTLKLMAPSAVFRLVVPDLEWRAKKYATAAHGGDAMAADAFLGSCLLGRRSRSRTPIALLRQALGNSEHLWMYDFPALKQALINAGFVNIRRCEYGDASDTMFAGVEDYGRFFDDGHRELAIEAARSA